MKSKNLLRGIVQGCSTFVLLLFFAVAVFAQQGTSTSARNSRRPQGNVVSDASVTLTNLGTGAARTTTTTDAGVYVFDFIAVGDYKVEVEAAGFKKKAVTDIHALIAKSTTVDIALEVGNVTETVTVSAGAAEVLVNRDDGTLGNHFVSKQITAAAARRPQRYQPVVVATWRHERWLRGWSACRPVKHYA